MMLAFVKKARPYLLGANRSGYLPRQLDRKLTSESAVVRTFVNDCLAKKTHALTILRREDSATFASSPLSLLKEMASPQKAIGKNELQVTITDGTKTIVENFAITNRAWEKDARQAWDQGTIRPLNLERQVSAIKIIVATLLVTFLIMFSIGVFAGLIRIGPSPIKAEL